MTGQTKTALSLEEKLSLLALIASLVLSFFAFGLPNHYYQPMFAILLVALCYHRGILPIRSHLWWILFMVLNFILLSFLLKLFIGGGRFYPFAWVSLPNLSLEQGFRWDEMIKILPQMKVSWVKPELGGFCIDITVIQSFLLVLIIATAVFEFQPFASLVAIILLFVSVPSLLTFEWKLVLPALVLSFAALYLQVFSPKKIEAEMKEVVESTTPNLK